MDTMYSDLSRRNTSISIEMRLSAMNVVKRSFRMTLMAISTLRIVGREGERPVKACGP